MKTFLTIVVATLAALTLLLAWMGIRTISRGLGLFESEGVQADVNGVFLLLGLVQLVGALVALFALYRFSRTWRLVQRRASEPAPTIRERALANLKSAQSSRS